MGKSPLIVLNDTSQNLSVGYYMDIEAHNLTSEVYMRSLSLSLSRRSVFPSRLLLLQNEQSVLVTL